MPEEMTEWRYKVCPFDAELDQEDDGAYVCISGRRDSLSVWE